ncbi:hypothetical protein QTP88_015221 [Uroleucon formosanum]
MYKMSKYKQDINSFYNYLLEYYNKNCLNYECKKCQFVCNRKRKSMKYELNRSNLTELGPYYGERKSEEAEQTKQSPFYSVIHLLHKIPVINK